MGNSKGWAVAAGILTAGAVGVYGFSKMLEEESGKEERKTIFEKLVEKQKVCDIADGQIILKWFRAHEQKGGANPVFFLAKPTEDTVRMFALGKLPKELDCEHSLLQAVVDGDSKKTKAIRMISFSSLQKEIADLLSEKDYVIIEGGTDI
ncbi:MAG: hypothetical protein IKW08_03800 [Roseburia sp.]|nr:hypothetical protein [Roseburia sp.]